MTRWFICGGGTSVIATGATLKEAVAALPAGSEPLYAEPRDCCDHCEREITPSTGSVVTPDDRLLCWACYVQPAEDYDYARDAEAAQ